MILKALWSAAFDPGKPLLDRRLPQFESTPAAVPYTLANGQQSHYPQLLAPRLGTPIIRPCRGISYKRGVGDMWVAIHVEALRLSCFHDDLSLNVAGHRFEPDLAYIDADRGIFIDIEVDEPYTMGRRVPTHTIGNDDMRNLLYTQAGWTVLRFSERQGIVTPKSVLRTVLDVVCQMDQSVEMPKALANIAPVEPDPRWNYDSAKQLARQRYRDPYLERHVPLYKCLHQFF